MGTSGFLRRYTTGTQGCEYLQAFALEEGILIINAGHKKLNNCP